MDLNTFSFLLDDDDDFLLLILLANSTRSENKSIFEKRNEEGSYEILVKRHLLDNDTMFVTYFRLSPYLFHKVADLIRNDIGVSAEMGGAKKYRISPEQKLCIALRYLVTGDSQTSLQFDSRISQQRISVILQEVFNAIKRKLMYLMPVPNETDWRKHAENFYNKWNFPNAIGAIDGKHIRIQCPPNSGSMYFNYKHFFSVVLLAIVDANYKYIAIDVGSFGRESDGGTFYDNLCIFHSCKLEFIF